MTDSEITTTILRQIRDEVIATRAELKAEIVKTNERLDTTNERVDAINERIDRLDTRTSNLERMVIGMHGSLEIVSRFVMNKHDKVIDELRKRIAKLEKKVG